jgi:hypothetical protein
MRAGASARRAASDAQRPPIVVGAEELAIPPE